VSPVNGGPPWVPSSITDSTPTSPPSRPGRPVEQPGDGADVLGVGEQPHPGLEVAALDDGGDAVELAGGAAQQQGQAASSRRASSSSEPGARLALAHSAAIRSAVSMTR
jgi:hypothetical protein